MEMASDRVEQLLAAEPYPRFSDFEMTARRELVGRIAAVAGVDRVVMYGSPRAGVSIFWLTGWLVTQEALAVVAPGERIALFVRARNHVPLAIEFAKDCDVAPGGPSSMESATQVIGRGDRVGVIGRLPHAYHETLARHCAEVVDLEPAFASARMVKSVEEIEWMRVGAHLSDLGALGLRDAAKPGVTVHRLADAVERAYVARGGDTWIHFIGLTSMEKPDSFVPAQWPTNRVVQAGDVITTEISAHFRSHPGQVLRTIAVDAEPTPRYKALHDVAQAAFDRIEQALRPGCTAEEIHEAASVIEDAGYTICDGLVHGFGGGYFLPHFDIRSLDDDASAQPPLEAGMLLVVQPNVIESGGPAGVQTGEMVLITEDGSERMHDVPRGFWRA